MNTIRKGAAYVRARLGEPSTYAGIAAALMPLAQYSQRLVTVVAACGVVAFLLKEGTKAPEQGQ
jgi:hypothetical protein